MRTRPIVVAILLVIAAVITAGYLLIPGAPAPEAPEKPEPREQPEQAEKPPQPQAQAPTEPIPFCERAFSAVAKREADIAELTAAGGLVYLLQRDQTAPPFQCAQFYLAHGLDVNAIDPRGEHGLTALHYAIKTNAPKMVAFVIDHGADLHRKAGRKNLQPMGYAYYLALNDTSIDRNRVIALLNEALVALENRETGDKPN